MPKGETRPSFLRSIITGSLFKMSDIRSETSLADIHTQIDAMRALARDSQISTALSYYATDATTTNTGGQIIWATAIDDKCKDVAEVVNALFRRWEIDAYARDHILELATIGNLYIPTTDMYKSDTEKRSTEKVALDNNTIPDNNFDILPSTKIPPEEIVHIWSQGKPHGYIYTPEDSQDTKYIRYPESAVIHFSLGGLLGDYTIQVHDKTIGEDVEYDIQFAQPLMEKAVQPTQTLNLLEDALVLASLIRVVKFINVDCGTADENEIQSSLQQIKDAIEQQLSLNTGTGDAQSFVNPQSPNNLIYVPKVNGQDAISITDLNMAEANETDSKLLQYYQDKKLSVLGVPKEAMNFSSNEGLGGAGAVMSQRSALYANSLQRLMTAYIAGWTKAINQYFISRNMSGLVGKFKLHMNPIITTQSTLQFDKRDAAITQLSTLIDILKNLGVSNVDDYRSAIIELLSEVLPQTSAAASKWNIELSTPDGDGGGPDAI